MSSTLEIVAVPGMTIVEVVRRSSARLSVPPTIHGLRVAQALQVHRFAVPQAQHPVSFAPGLIGLLQMRDGVVESVRIGPHEEYLHGGTCVAVLDACSAALDGAGWRRDGQYSGEQALVRASHGAAALAGVWIDDKIQARLTLRRAHTADSVAGRLLRLTSDAFIVNVHIG